MTSTHSDELLEAELLEAANELGIDLRAPSDRCRYHCKWTGEVIEGGTPLEARTKWTKHLHALGKVYGV